MSTYTCSVHRRRMMPAACAICRVELIRFHALTLGCWPQLAATSAAFPIESDVDVELLEPEVTPSMAAFVELADWADRQMSALLLGHAL